MEYGVDYLRQKLRARQARVNTRYQYYEMKNAVQDYSKIIPQEFKSYSACLGWCAKSVDALADRLSFREFRNDNFDMTGIFQMNNADVLFDSAVLSALISSCCFVYISAGTDAPQLQVIDGANATGIIDPVTGLLKEGYAILAMNEKTKQPTLEAYFTADKTIYYEQGKESYELDNPTGVPLLVPIIYRPDAKRAFGHSRISRAEMEIMQGALRTLKRVEISAEFYSFPQKYVLGMSPDAEPMDSVRATMSTLLQFTKDDDGDKPTVGQFTQQSMSPFTEQLRTYASLFAGESGLTMDDLGFVTDNPSSAEAIKASHENLRLAARKAQKTFGSGFLNVGYLAACLRDEYPYKRSQIYLTEPVWEPVFEPDSSMLSMIGDGIIKLEQAIPGYVTEDKVKDLTGI